MFKATDKEVNPWPYVVETTPPILLLCLLIEVLLCKPLPAAYRVADSQYQESPVFSMANHKVIINYNFSS